MELVFSVGPGCKEIRHIKMKNDGTKAIRYIWLRFPPNGAMKAMLKDTQAHKFNYIYDVEGGGDTRDVPRILKNACFEFHFPEVPSVLLPGESIDLPIIFAPRNPGYYFEIIHLLTHPSPNNEDGKEYSTRLTGICMDFDRPLEQTNLSQTTVSECKFQAPEKIGRGLDRKILEEEARRVVKSIIEHVIANKETQKTDSLPYGKATAEMTFKIHNPKFHYHLQESEMGVEVARNLVTLLVPKERAVLLSKDLCPLSIESLYFQLWESSDLRDYSTEMFKTEEAEDLLAKLTKHNVESMKPRIFTWSELDVRTYTACYSQLVATFDKIVKNMQPISKGVKTSSEFKRIFKVRAEREISEMKKLGIDHVEEEKYKVPKDNPYVRKNRFPDYLKEALGPKITESKGAEINLQKKKSTKKVENKGGKTTKNSKNTTKKSPIASKSKKLKKSKLRTASRSSTESRNSIRFKMKLNSQADDFSSDKNMFNMSLEDYKLMDLERAHIFNLQAQMFKELLTAGIDRMLSTYDTMNSIIDYGRSDINPHVPPQVKV